MKLAELVELVNAQPLVGILVNWLWQGSAVALVATAILRVSRRLSATSRYHLWWVALSVVLVLPAFSFRLPASSFQRPAPSFQLPHSGLRQEALNGQPGEPASIISAGSWKLRADSWQPATGSVILPTFPVWGVALLALVWFGWVVVSISRTLLALVALGEAKRAARPFPVSREARLEIWLSLRGRGRRAALGLSDSVRAAAVLGLTSPAIVVAPSALAALDDEELDQIVVHEWAHVQRRDDLARLVQRLIVAVAGLHPGVWWIDRQLNLERETACDDWAINATGSARGLAVCLTKLAAMPGRPADALLLPAAFLSSELTTRVVRLLDGGRNTSTTWAAGAALIVVPVLSAVAFAVASVQLVVTSPLSAPDRPAASTGAAVVATVEPALDRSAVGSRRDFGRPEQKVGPALRPREVAPGVATTLSPSTPARDSSESGRSVERPGVAPGSEARSATQQPEAIGPAVRVAFEGTLEADLPGLRVAAIADLVPAAAEGSGRPAGASAGLPATPWAAAADAGVTVGKGTQRAAVATAGFFTRLSKSITDVF